MNKTVQLTPQGTLLCPRCREDYLHQSSVQIHVRAAEDAEGLCVTVEVDSTKIHALRADSTTFGGRRDDLVIAFTCEHCEDDLFRLRIVQHKGNTYFEWILADALA